MSYPKIRIISAPIFRRIPSLGFSVGLTADYSMVCGSASGATVSQPGPGPTDHRSGNPSPGRWRGPAGRRLVYLLPDPPIASANHALGQQEQGIPPSTG